MNDAPPTAAQTHELRDLEAAKPFETGRVNFASTYKCPFCGAGAIGIAEFLRHIRSEHPGRTLEEGKGLAMLSAGVRELRESADRAAPYRDDVDGQLSYRCPDCAFRAYGAGGPKGVLEHVAGAHIPAAAASDVPLTEELKSVAIHYVGDGSQVPGIPVDPTVTTFVTPSAWARYRRMTGNDGMPLIGLGEASPRVDEASPKLAKVLRELRQRLASLRDVRDKLRHLTGDALDDTHRPYWRRQVAEQDRAVFDYLKQLVKGRSIVVDEPTSDPPIGDDHWRDAYRRYVDKRITAYEVEESPSLADIGYAPRRVDPTWRGGYTNRWGNAVDFSADENGIVQPLNDDEVKLLNDHDLTIAFDPSASPVEARGPDEVHDDTEFPVLAKLPDDKRQAHRESLCKRRRGLLSNCDGLEDQLIAYPIDARDRQINESPIVLLQRWAEEWGRLAGLGNTETIRAAIDDHKSPGGDMGPPKRKRLLATVRNIHAWVEYHRHNCTPERPERGKRTSLP